VRDPGLGVDSPVLDELDDAGKVTRQRVTTGPDVQFTTMQRGGVWHRDVVLGDADINQTPLERTVVQRLGHRAEHGRLPRRGIAVHEHSADLGSGTQDSQQARVFRRRTIFFCTSFGSAHRSSNIANVPLLGENESIFGILSGFKARNVIFSRYGFGLFAIIWNADLRYIYFGSLSWWPMSNKSSHLI